MLGKDLMENHQGPAGPFSIHFHVHPSYPIDLRRNPIKAAIFKKGSLTPFQIRLYSHYQELMNHVSDRDRDDILYSELD